MVYRRRAPRTLLRGGGGPLLSERRAKLRALLGRQDARHLAAEQLPVRATRGRIGAGVGHGALVREPADLPLLIRRERKRSQGGAPAVVMRAVRRLRLLSDGPEPI